jgi:hypothetical protein
VELTTQCGGPDVVTPALALLIEQAAVKAIIAKAVGEYVLKQECPVQKDQLIAVVMQHDTVQKTLALLLEKIGLEAPRPRRGRSSRGKAGSSSGMSRRVSSQASARSTLGPTLSPPRSSDSACAMPAASSATLGIDGKGADRQEGSQSMDRRIVPLAIAAAFAGVHSQA